MWVSAGCPAAARTQEHVSNALPRNAARMADERKPARGDDSRLRHARVERAGSRVRAGWGGGTRLAGREAGGGPRPRRALADRASRARHADPPRGWRTPAVRPRVLRPDRK